MPGAAAAMTSMSPADDRRQPPRSRRGPFGINLPSSTASTLAAVLFAALFVIQSIIFQSASVKVTDCSEVERANIRREILEALDRHIVEKIDSNSSATNKTSEVVPLEEDIPAYPKKQLLILVSPTYTRAAQHLHIQKLVNVLRLVPPPILWIVVEAYEKTEETARLLKESAGKCLITGIATNCATVNYIHMASTKPPDNPRNSRGVGQRNAALEFIEQKRLRGIVYFMDDDNVYTPMLFEEFRKMKQNVGILPVGLLWSKEYARTVSWKQAGAAIERALVEVDSSGNPKVYGWETFEWALKSEPGKGRKYHLDMAAFAFKSELLWTPTDAITKKPSHPVRFTSKPAWLETLFLDRLIKGLEELEPLADNGRDVYIWHVRFETASDEPYPKDWRIDQPQNLVPDNDPIPGISRYVLANGTRHKVKGYNDTIPFGYKRVKRRESKKAEAKEKPKQSKTKS